MKRIVLFMMVFLVLGCTSIWAEQSQITLRYTGNSVHDECIAQFELIGSSGSRVMINVHDPAQLSAPAGANDILLTTQPINDSFTSTFPGKTLLARIGEIKQNGVYVRGIASAHRKNDAFRDENGTNYIFLIEMDGLRIADFGGIGQDKLTPEQLSALGRVDIALTPLFNQVNGTNALTLRAFNLMEQVKPKIVIPTSMDMDTAKYAVEEWQGAYWDKPELRIGGAMLSDKTQVLFMGPNANLFAKACKLKKLSF